MTREAKAAFDRIDENRDDSLTQDEFRTLHEKSIQPFDGPPKKLSLDPTTIRQMFMQAFEDADENDSGGLNLEGFTAFFEKRAERAGQQPTSSLE